ncbi:hypothetical protein QZH41_011477, partial [Actinostola sp. cb2023]
QYFSNMVFGTRTT